MASRATVTTFSFCLLPEGESRLNCFGAGFGLEFLALALLIGVPLLMPQKLEVARRYWTTSIAAPPIEAWKPQPQPKPQPKPVPVKLVAKVTPKAEEIVAPPKVKLVAPVFKSPISKPATAKRNTPTPDAPDVARALANPASLGSSAIPTLKKPREEVQTGGFGDPNGLPSNGNTKRAPNVAQLGSYDLPPGPGYGNGTGGSKGARGTVASAGFGNGVAIGGSGGQGHGIVQQGLFADEHAAAPASKVHQVAASPVAQPVEITYKPRPVYTDEARNLKIEGEVLLEAVFTAAGQLQVQRVVRGLGHGLDESAMSAARAIRFKPAHTADGQPVDSTAIVHIVFELAY
ncbi:MAG: energy transducer TonB [Candidatus Acidiferrales bacterium]